MALRVGFVGVGGISGRHLSYCQAREDVEIVGHMDTDLKRARAAKKTYGGAARLLGEIVRPEGAEVIA